MATLSRTIRAGSPRLGRATGTEKSESVRTPIETIRVSSTPGEAEEVDPVALATLAPIGTEDTSASTTDEATADHPYKVEIQENPSSPGTYQAKVIADSLLFDDLDPSTEITITNLDTWFALLGSGEDKIWVMGTTIDGSAVNQWPAVQSAAIESFGQSNTWDGGVVEHDGETPPVQTISRRVIATINCDVTPPVVLVQHVRSHLTLRLLPHIGQNADGTGSTTVAAVFPEAS